jgi:hypothetical protein
MEGLKSIIAGNFANVEKAAAPLVTLVKQIPLFIIKDTYSEMDYKTSDLITANFARAIEIITNIFFRAVEYAEKGEMSLTIDDCLETIRSSGLIDDRDLWLEMALIDRTGDKNRSPNEMIPECNRIIARYVPEIEQFLERAGDYIARIP